MNIVNPGAHTHRPTTIGGQQICQDCQQVLITPILTFEQFELRMREIYGANFAELLDDLRSLFPCPIDWWLLHASNVLWDGHLPPYIGIIGNEDWPTEMPPHTRFGATARWWND